MTSSWIWPLAVGTTLPRPSFARRLASPRWRRVRRYAAWRPKGEIGSPSRGFYVIVPSEYRRLGCLPADQFVPALMERRGIRYYVGLLSAAQYHGVDRVAGVLAELGDDIDPGRLVEASKSASILWAQRLGYLLEYVGAGDKAVLLKEHVGRRARNFTKLLPGDDAEGAPRWKDWRLFANANIEIEA